MLHHADMMSLLCTHSIICIPLLHHYQIISVSLLQDWKFIQETYCVSFPFFPLSPVFTHLGCLSQTDSEFAPRENLFTITHMTSLLYCGSNRERSIFCSIYLAHSMCSINIHLLNKNLGNWEFPYWQTWRLGETCALRECGGSASLLTYLALCISSVSLVLKYILLQ